MKVTVATCPCSWGVWYKDGTPAGTPWNVFLNQAEEAGYKALELGPLGYIPGDYKQIKDEVSKRNMYVCSSTIFYSFGAYETEKKLFADAEEMLTMTKALKAKYVVAMDGTDFSNFIDKRSCYTPGNHKQIFQMIKALKNHAKAEYGLEVVFHPHISTSVEYEHEIVALMEETGIDLCLDTGHHCYANTTDFQNDNSVIPFIQQYKDRIKYLHFKNVDGKVRARVEKEGLTSDEAFDLEVMCELNKGIIDFEALKNTLNNIEFEGIGVIEQDIVQAENHVIFTMAKNNLQYLQKIEMI